LWVLAEESLRAVLWFHPAIWFLTARIRLAREAFTDHLAVLATGDRRAYVEALLAFSEGGRRLDPAPAFARRGHLFHRIVLLSKEAAMSSRRIVVSGGLIAALLVSGSWYVTEVFPLVGTPVLRAAAPASAKAAAGRPADLQLPAAASEPVNTVTPDNPIPRRLFSTPIPYPAELAGSGYVGAVEIVVVLNLGGSVASATRATVAASLEEPQAPGSRESSDVSQRAMDAFVETAITSIRQWQYDPPARAPLRFYVAATFRPGQDAAVSQSDTGRGVVAGQGSARLATAADRAALAAGVRQWSQSGSRMAGAIATPVRIADGMKGPTPIRMVKPAYPRIAMSARVQGDVLIELVIDEQGKVSNATIVRSIPLLDQAALDAVRQWEFTPTMIDNVPVPVIVTTSVGFTLRDVAF
jgi:protein TonB